MAKFNRHGIKLPKPPESEIKRNQPHESNFSMILRAHVAVQVGRLTEDWFWGGVDAVLCERKKKWVKNCFGFLWTDWSGQNPNAGKTFSARKIRLPNGWYDRTRAAFRRPEPVPRE